MARYKQRKYEGGGAIPFAEAGQFGASIVDMIEPENQFGARSDFGAGASGALKAAGTGAAIGTAVFPGIGTAVGAGVGALVGAIGGKKKNDAAQKAQAEFNHLQARNTILAGQKRLANYNTAGDPDALITAKYGGKIGEPKMKALGGTLDKISANNVEVNGNTHEEGGVRFGGVEVEDKETITGDNYVFSEELGFAKKHKRIANSLAKIEKKPINTERLSSIKLLQAKENKLKAEQEQVKEILGLGTPINAFPLGGQIEPGNPYTPFFKGESRKIGEQYKAITDYGRITRADYERAQEDISQFPDDHPLANSFGAFADVRKEFKNNPLLDSVSIGEYDFSRIPAQIVNGKESFAPNSNISRKLGPVVYDRTFREADPIVDLGSGPVLPSEPIAPKEPVRKVYSSDVEFGFKGKKRPGINKVGFNKGKGRLGVKINR